MLCEWSDKPGIRPWSEFTQYVDGPLIQHMEKDKQIHRKQSEGGQGDLVLRFIVKWLVSRRISTLTASSDELALPDT